MRQIAISTIGVFIASLFSCACCSAQSSVTEGNSTDERLKAAKARRDALEALRSSIDFGKSWLKDRNERDFVEWEFDKAEGLSAFRELFWFIADDVRPARREEPRYPLALEPGVELAVAVFAAQVPEQNDLIEFRWIHDGRALRVVASRNAFKVDFMLSEISACRSIQSSACVREARAWVENVLKLEGQLPSGGDRPFIYHVDLPWPEHLSEGIEFSSAPDRNIMRIRGFPEWYERVDAFVENGVLSILIYRKIGQLMGYLDGSTWFSEEFREQVHERAREEGKLPHGPGGDD